MIKHAAILLIALLTACSGQQPTKPVKVQQTSIGSIVQSSSGSSSSNIVAGVQGSVSISGNGNVVIDGSDDEQDAKPAKLPEFHYHSEPSGDVIRVETEDGGGVSVNSSGDHADISVSKIKRLFVNGVEWKPVKPK